METKYKLLIHGVGNYTADTLPELIWIVLKTFVPDPRDQNGVYVMVGATL